jgi:hypothetical protein
MKKFFGAILTDVLLAVLVLASAQAARMEYISKDEYGDKWPFTISSGRLECRINAVILHTDRGTYNINGKAMDRYARRYKPITEILKPHPLPTVAQAGGFFPISDTDIIQRGLKLCE